MVKVIPIKNLFDSQQVVGVKEPLEITTFTTSETLPFPTLTRTSSIDIDPSPIQKSRGFSAIQPSEHSADEPESVDPQCCFLVATKEGVVEVFRVSKAEERPQLLHQLKTVIHKSLKDASNPTLTTIFALSYLQPPNDAIVTLEYESEKSQITVVRIYSNWRSVPSKRVSKNYTSFSQIHNPQDLNASVNYSFSFEHDGQFTLPTPSSVMCMAVCETSSRVVVSTRSTITIWKIFDQTTKAEQILSLNLESSNGPVTKLAIHESYLAYCTNLEVRIINLVVEQSQVNEERPISRLIKAEDSPLRSEEHPYLAIEDENCFECCFDEGGNLTSGSLTTMKLPIPGISPGTTTDTRGKIEVLGPIIDINHGVHVNHEAGYSLASATLILYRSFIEDEIHSLSFVADHGMISPDLSINSYGEPASKSDVSVRCFFSTSRTGYLYDISNPSFLCDFPYTSVSITCALSPHFMYAATTGGLEIWTLRTSEFGRDGARSSGASEKSKNFPGPCLLGLLPFIGLKRIEISGDYVILLSKIDNTNEKDLKSSAKSQKSSLGWNLYVLHSTSLSNIFDEFITRAEAYQIEQDPQVYIQLVLEAHFLARAKLTTLQRDFEEMGASRTGIEKSILSMHLEAKHFHELLQKSATLLGDFYMNLGEYMTAATFYARSDKKLSQVVSSMILVVGNQADRALIRYLERVLYDPNEQMDETPELSEKILQHYYDNFQDKISSLILESKLSKYSNEFVLKLLKNSGENSGFSKDSFARAIIALRSGMLDTAASDFSSVKPERLFEYLSALLLTPRFGPEYVKFVRMCSPWAVLEAVSEFLAPNIPGSPRKGSRNASSSSETLDVDGVLQILLDPPNLKNLPFRAAVQISGDFLCMCFLEDRISRLEDFTDQSETYKEEFREDVKKLVQLYSRYIDVDSLNGFNVTEPPKSIMQNNSITLQEKWMLNHQRAFYATPEWLYAFMPEKDRLWLGSQSSSTPKTARRAIKKKISGLLTSPFLRSDKKLAFELASLLSKHEKQVEIALLCYPLLDKLEQGSKLVVISHPEVAVEYGKQYCSEPNHWRQILKHFLDGLASNNNQRFYREAYKNVLTFLTRNYDPPIFLSLLPESGNMFFFLPYIESSISYYKSKLLKDSLLKEVDKADQEALK